MTEPSISHDDNIKSKSAYESVEPSSSAAAASSDDDQPLALKFFERIAEGKKDRKAKTKKRKTTRKLKFTKDVWRTFTKGHVEMHPEKTSKKEKPRMSVQSVDAVQSIIHEVIEKILREMSTLAAFGKKNNLSIRSVASATKFVLGPNIAETALNAGAAAATRIEKPARRGRGQKSDDMISRPRSSPMYGDSPLPEGISPVPGSPALPYGEPDNGA
mmetsp:Transcript_51959/g.91247  ORF Transcript_51959/g.91247 Transcript_51959/m.91247 type:complete len:216 (+) Transcript_51959:93-740(+)